VLYPIWHVTKMLFERYDVVEMIEQRFSNVVVPGREK